MQYGSRDRVVGEENKYTTTSKKRNKKEKKARKSVWEQFCEDFAAEIDPFDWPISFPDWLLRKREQVLARLSPSLRRICYELRSLGLTFKIKWPVEIDGKWKFADVLFPRQRTVLMVVNPMEIARRPHWMLSDRGEFFKDRFRVVEVETLEELQRKIANKRDN